ncbi:LysE/ArgO family amino acid transporter [Nesterenkonia alba]|uniref:LysE/ArgO family amino acid transporter n=1 Tax=Nesterenkonia alba TaxID=515814 RepID=UPI0003B55942|nr:LysE/ArgO family amino acid transporter [Nesterenkonia alba]
MMTVLLTGFLACMALIVAIGPQSAFLLRQGLRRDRVAVATACCLLGDVLLIAAGTAGVGAILDTAPWLLEVIRWAGVAYLLWFAVRSFRSAMRPRDDVALLSPEKQNPASPQHRQRHREHSGQNRELLEVTMTSSIPVVKPDDAVATRQKVKVTHVSRVSAVAATGLTVSILNPHAWVDSLVVLGSMANSFADERWFFAGGAMLASVVWLLGLAWGSSALAKVLNRPRVWQVIDASVGVIMVAVAGLLAAHGF